MSSFHSHAFAGQPAGLLHPVRELLLVELALVDVEISYFFLFGLTDWERAQRGAAEERHFHVLRKAMKAEEPAALLDAVERRVPFHRLLHARDGADDEHIEPLADLALPARHGRDLGLHRRLAIALGDLRIAAGEQRGLCAAPL